MSNHGCRDIVYREFPDKLEAWFRVEKKLHTMKGANELDPTEKILGSEFDPEEREVLIKLLMHLVKEYEKKHGPLSYLVDKFGPSMVTLVLREVLGKLM